MAIALLSGLLTASAAITPYSWFRFNQQYPRIPGFDATGQGHDIRNGYTGNGESPYGTRPENRVVVGGPLGPDGIWSTAAIRSRAGNTANQGTMFEEPNPLNTTTFTNLNPWGNFFQYQTNWVTECWFIPQRTGGNDASIVFATGLNRNNRSVGRQSGVALEVMNGTNAWNIVAGGAGMQIFSPAGNGVPGTAQNNGDVWIRCRTMAPLGAVDKNGNTMDFQIGPAIKIKSSTNAAWMHYAVVLDSSAGTLGWYTNGTLVASVPSYRLYTTNYFSSVGMLGQQDVGYAASVDNNGNQGLGLWANARPLEGYTAEMRFSTFNPGEFSTTNLLTRRVAAGSPVVSFAPGIAYQPANTLVQVGAGAAFQVVPGTDTSMTYQWSRNGTPIANATNSVCVLENAQLANNGDSFTCVLTASTALGGNGLSTTSSAGVLTVIPANTALNTGYSNAIMAESSLVAYFPVDGSTGTTLNNVKDPTRNGAIMNGAWLNGDTNKAAGLQTLTFNSPNQDYVGGYGLYTNKNGYVEIPGDIAGLTNGNGNITVETVIYMDPSARIAGTSEAGTIVNLGVNVAGQNAGQSYLTLRADHTGALYFYSSQQSGGITWVAPAGLLGKKSHVVLVHKQSLAGTNATMYVNGVSLGTKLSKGLGNVVLPSATSPIWLGRREIFADSLGSGFWQNMWRGTIDDVSLYNAALTGNQVATHYYRYVAGSVDSPASIASISPSKSLLTGFPVQSFFVNPAGLAPFTYQWYKSGVAVLNATNNTYAWSGSGVTAGSYTFAVSVQGAMGSSVTSAPIVMTVVDPTGYAAKVYASSGGAPKAFYPLAETSGTTIFDWAGTHDGTLYGAYELGRTGPVPGTGSLKMFGTNSPTEWSMVQVPFYAELNPQSGNMTHEFWYRPASSNTVGIVSSQFNIGNAKAGLCTMLGFGTVGVNQTTVQFWTMILGKFNNTNQGIAQNGAGTALTVPTINDWYHIASVCDANNHYVFIFVNGNAEYSQDAGYSVYPGDGSTTGGWNQNDAAPLLLGNRNLGTVPMDGQLSMVAIYDYPLTATDITNHTSLSYVAAQFTSQPAASNSKAEGFDQTLTLSANAIGAPNIYEWQKNGVALTQVTLPDGSSKYPVIAPGGIVVQGVNSRQLVIRELNPGDAGTYTLRAYNGQNPNGYTNSAGSVLTVSADTTQPVVLTAAALATTVSGPVIDSLLFTGGTPTPALLSLVEVRFNKRMDPATATNKANYTISGPGSPTINGVVLSGAFTAMDTKYGADQRTVTLQTSGLQAGATYTVTVSGVKDQNYTPKTTPTTSLSVTAPTLRTNSALWDYYYAYNGTYGSRASGTNSSFPLVPQMSLRFTNMSLANITGGANTDLQNIGIWNASPGGNPGGPGYGNSYFHTITAWITPTNSGYYQFFVEANDNDFSGASCQLFMNTAGADPAGATLVNQALSGNTSFALSTPVTIGPLTAGQPYFIQVQGVNSGGNDMMQVAWLYIGADGAGYTDGSNGAWNVTPAALTPIDGKFLSAYVSSPQFTATTTASGKVILNWTGTGRVFQSSDLINWTALGVQTSPLTITPSPSTPQVFYKFQQ